jgi:hypothetical protein
MEKHIRERGCHYNIFINPTQETISSPGWTRSEIATISHTSILDWTWSRFYISWYCNPECNNFALYTYVKEGAGP